MIKRDKIYIEDLRVKGTIGIFDWEKKIKQKIDFFQKTKKLKRTWSLLAAVRHQQAPASSTFVGRIAANNARYAMHKAAAAS